MESICDRGRDLTFSAAYCGARRVARVRSAAFNTARNLSSAFLPMMRSPAKFMRATSMNRTRKTRSFPKEYSVDRYDQSAIFLAPIPRKGYGLRVRPLDLDEARRYGTNRGLVVVAIRTGSPGFLSDILPGDVILQVNGRPVYDLASYNAAMPWGQALDLEIRRDGVVIRKSLQIRPTGEWPTG